MRLIDADAVIDAIEKSKTAKAEDGEVFVAKINVLMKIDALPTIQPQTSHWIIDGHHIRCSKCGETMCNTDREGDPIPRNFCPNCGARMVTGA